MGFLDRASCFCLITCRQGLNILHAHGHEITPGPLCFGVSIDERPESFAMTRFSQVSQFVHDDILEDELGHAAQPRRDTNGPQVGRATAEAFLLLAAPPNGVVGQAVVEITPVQCVCSLIEEVTIEVRAPVMTLDSFGQTSNVRLELLI